MEFDGQKIIQITSAMNGDEHIIWGLNGFGEMHLWEWDKARRGYYWKPWPNIGVPNESASQ